MRCQSCNAPFSPDRLRRCAYCGAAPAEKKTLMGSVRIETADQSAAVIIPDRTPLP